MFKNLGLMGFFLEKKVGKLFEKYGLKLKKTQVCQNKALSWENKVQEEKYMTVTRMCFNKELRATLVRELYSQGRGNHDGIPSRGISVWYPLNDLCTASNDHCFLFENMANRNIKELKRPWPSARSFVSISLKRSCHSLM